MAVPNTFGTATSAIPLSQLDANFNTPITLGNTAIQLGDTVTTLNNMTLANVTISSGNVTITNVGITNANVSGTANISTLVVVGNATVGGNTTITGNITAANANVTTNLVLSGGTANGVAYLNTSKVLTTGSALSFNGTDFATTGKVASGSTGAAGRFDLARASDGGVVVALGLSGNDFSANNGASGSYIFNINSSEALRLTSTSLYTASTINVGIGTSSPSARLGIEIPNYASSSTNGMIRFQNPNVAADSCIQSYYVTGTGSDVYIGSNSFVNTSGSTARFSGSYASSGINIGRNGNISFLTNTSAGDPQARMALDSSGNLGLGVTPSNWASFKAIEVGRVGNGISTFTSAGGAADLYLTSNVYYNGGFKYANANQPAGAFSIVGNTYQWNIVGVGTNAGDPINFTQAMTLDASGNLLVGTTSSSAYFDGKLRVAATGTCASFTTSTSGAIPIVSWNSATTGDNNFVSFNTEAGATLRGSITYNRAGGLVAYNTTSDYRAKDISGPITNSGVLIDSVPVYMGTMKGATQERPMFIAHETPAYAHTGEKDAVDADGKPVYQQMDASALIPVMWAEIQSLRKRLAAAGI